MVDNRQVAVTGPDCSERLHCTNSFRRLELNRRGFLKGWATFRGFGGVRFVFVWWIGLVFRTRRRIQSAATRWQRCALCACLASASCCSVCCRTPPDIRRPCDSLTSSHLTSTVCIRWLLITTHFSLTWQTLRCVCEALCLSPSSSLHKFRFSLKRSWGGFFRSCVSLHLLCWTEDSTRWAMNYSHKHTRRPVFKSLLKFLCLIFLCKIKACFLYCFCVNVIWL